MLGPDPIKNKGGIATVSSIYLKSDLVEKYNLTYISTHIDGNKAVKLFQFIKSMFPFFYHLLSARIVHSHISTRASFYRKSFFVLLSKLFGKKVIFHVRGATFNVFYHDNTLIKKWFIRKVMNLSDVVIALSPQWKKDLGKIMRSEEKIKILYNPIVLPRDVKNHKKGHIISLLFMGRLGIRKGVYDLIQAAEKIIGKKRKVKFILCGDGEIKKVRKIIEKKGLSNNFEVPGWIEDKEKYLKKADIFVLPTYHEGLPNAILEAIAAGLPAISTPVGGIPEAVHDGKNGFLIEPGDVSALQEKILLLARDHKLRAQMGNQSRKIAEEKFEHKKILLQLESIYDSLLNPNSDNIEENKIEGVRWLFV